MNSLRSFYAEEQMMNIYNQVSLFTRKTRVSYVINMYTDLPIHRHFLLLPLMWLHHACLSQLFVHKT